MILLVNKDHLRILVGKLLAYRLCSEIEDNATSTGYGAGYAYIYIRPCNMLHDILE